MADQTLSPLSVTQVFVADISQETITVQLSGYSSNHAIQDSISHLNDFTLTILTGDHDIVSGVSALAKSAYIPVKNSVQLLKSAGPRLTTGGGSHDNTEWISYSGQDYLKCRHLYGTLTGTYTSEIYDLGAEKSNRHLIYVVGEDAGEIDIVIVGEGTTWDDKMPSPATWNSVNVSTQTWSEIFDLPGAPSVEMRLYYGTSSPPTSYVDRLEILSAIIPANNQYFQLRITITDPSEQVYAYVEAYTLKFCTY